VVDRLLGLYRARRDGDEELGAFFRRVGFAAATAVLEDLAKLTPEEATDQDYVDLAETTAFTPEILDGECSA
jgi:hypothetical protein